MECGSRAKTLPDADAGYVGHGEPKAAAVCRTNGADYVTVGFKGEYRLHLGNVLDGHGLFLNLINERNKALDVDGFDGPVGWHRQWVTHRRMRKNEVTAPGASHFHALMNK